VVLQDGLMQPDGIHPNARGVDVIVERITPLLASVLQDS
jgi:lysophospholipase L1-like esterase